MRKDDLLSLVKYAHDKNLTNTNGWKGAKKYKKYINKYVKFITKLNTLKSQKDKARNKFKFGFQTPENTKQAHLWEKLNGDTNWADAIA